MKTDYDAKKCYLCRGENADSDDHIPPKNIFLEETRAYGKGLITVPSHKKCNKRNERDDEYFRIFLLIPSCRQNEFAQKLWNNKIYKQIHRPECKGFKKYLSNNLIPVDVFSKGGIYLGNAEAEAIDTRRVLGVVERTAKGIYYKCMKTLMPIQWHVEACMIDSQAKVGRKELEEKGEFENIGNGTFKYFWKYYEEENKAFFWFSFFDCIDFLVYGGQINKDEITPNGSKS